MNGGSDGTGAAATFGDHSPALPMTFAPFRLAALAAVLFAGAAAAQPVRTPRVPAPSPEANDRAVAAALAGLGVDVRDGGAAWDAVPDAFDALYPGAAYGQTVLSPVQARAVAFTALAQAGGPPVETGRYPVPGAPTPPAPSQTAQSRALELAFAFVALVPTGSVVPVGAERTALVARGSEAAGAAGAAGCSTLGSALSNVTARIRATGYAYSDDVTTVQRAAGTCR